MTTSPGDTEPITFVGPAAAEAKLAKLGALPGMAVRVAAVRAEMDAADRAAAEEWGHPGGDAGRGRGVVGRNRHHGCVRTTDELTKIAVDACDEILRAGEVDLPSWLAKALASVAARHGGSWALVTARPGSWEAPHVLALVQGLIGLDDEELGRI